MLSMFRRLCRRPQAENVDSHEASFNNRLPADLTLPILAFADTQEVGRIRQISRLFCHDRELKNEFTERTNVVNVYCQTALSRNDLKRNSTFILRRDGRVLVYGDNSEGQLGLGHRNPQKKPVLIPNLTNVKSIAVGYEHTLFLLKDGTVKACGNNASGRLGFDRDFLSYPNQYYLIPTLIPGLSNVVQIDTSREHSVFVLADHRVKVCGSNLHYRLGLENFNNDSSLEAMNRYRTPHFIPDLNNVRSAHTTPYATYFRLLDGSVKVCGCYPHTLDTNVNDIRQSPLLIPGLTNVREIVTPRAQGFSSINGYTSTVFFILDNGQVKACGNNKHGQLGIPNVNEQRLPQVIPGLMNVEKIVASGDSTIILLSDGTLRSYGTTLSTWHNDPVNHNQMRTVRLPNFGSTKLVALESDFENIFMLLDTGKLYTSKYSYLLAPPRPTPRRNCLWNTQSHLSHWLPTWLSAPVDLIQSKSAEEEQLSVRGARR